MHLMAPFDLGLIDGPLDFGYFTLRLLGFMAGLIDLSRVVRNNF